MHRIYRQLWGLIVILALPGLATHGQEIETFLAHQYDYQMISSGNNFPSVRLDQDHLGEVCILLHEGVLLARMRDHFHWTDAELQRRLQALEQDGLVRLEAGGYRPVMAVITQSDAQRYFLVSPGSINNTAAAIAALVPELKTQSARIDGLRSIPFPELSFFLMSDALLDNWQIRNVEDEMFHAPRTEHAGKHYYYSIQEKASPATESFGIYGNSQAGFGEVAIGLYGNTRDSENLVTMSSKQIAEKCGLEPSINGQPLKKTLLLEIVRNFPDVAKMAPAHRQCLQALGLATESSVTIPVLGESDDQVLSQLAKKLTPRLLTLLRHERPRLEKLYRKSPYVHEISFQEFFMWWYHFFYTAVTNELVRLRLVALPTTGTFTYLRRR